MLPKLVQTEVYTPVVEQQCLEAKFTRIRWFARPRTAAWLSDSDCSEFWVERACAIRLEDFTVDRRVQ
jgi:hypothetical protein